MSPDIRRLDEAGYYVVGVRGGESWAWKPPGPETWRRKYRTEQGAIAAAILHLTKDKTNAG